MFAVKPKGMNFMNKGMLKTGCQLAFAMAMLVELSGCASSANPAAMAVTAPAPAAKPFPQPLQHAMCVRNVTGGEETNPLWVSKVDDKGFRQALSASLDGAGLSAPTPNCVFPIDANLLGLSQPGMGFDMEVTSHVNYKVYDASGQPIVLATIDAPYTAKFSDAFAGVERLRLANEGSIRTSISMFFDKLRDSTPK
jgi:hypothetical protein